MHGKIPQWSFLHRALKQRSHTSARNQTIRIIQVGALQSRGLEQRVRVVAEPFERFNINPDIARCIAFSRLSRK